MNPQLILLVFHLGLINLFNTFFDANAKSIESRSSKNFIRYSAATIDKSFKVLDKTHCRQYIIKADTLPILLRRNFLGKEVSFSIDPAIENGMTKVVWESRPFNDQSYTNQIVQVAPHILLYQEYPDSLSMVFYNTSQPVKIEFLDSSFQTLQLVDIWSIRPYQTVHSAKSTYYHFNAEGMSVLPYDKQGTILAPDEYSLFTGIVVVGHHLILSYKQLALNGSTIIGMKTSLFIYNLNGDAIAEINDIPSWDQGVISPNGLYMLYIFGGNAATVNQPFAQLERPGWAIMNLQSKAIVYSEFETDGTHIDGVFYTQGFLEVNSVTPFDAEHYDYKVFFDESTHTIYKKFWLQREWDDLLMEFDKTKIKDWKYYILKYNFEKIVIATGQ
jgi:hypothetical protein